jgi:hypothetical protein
MVINEQDRKDILSKYNDNTSKELLVFLKRNYPVYSMNTNWSEIEEFKMIMVDDKSYILKGNKKFLVDKIDSDLTDRWAYVDNKVRRRTIKKYLDGVMI